MINFNANMENILYELSRKDLNENQVADIFNNPIVFPAELIEKLSIETALKYWDGKITYNEGDRIINRIYDFWNWNFT